MAGMGARRAARGAGAAVTAVALGWSLALAAAGPAMADSGESHPTPHGTSSGVTPQATVPELALDITSTPNSAVSAGSPVSFTYTVTNDTGSTYALPSGAAFDIMFKFEYYSDGPQTSACDFAPYGFADFGDYVIGSYVYDSTQVMQPGASLSCTVTYTPTAADVSYGGLWTQIVYESPDDVANWPAWQYGYWYAVASVGHSANITIKGTPAVGQTLTIDPGLWGPWDPPFTYQWMRNGVDISGATGATYTPTAADVGGTLSVTLTTQNTGITRTSLSTVPVSLFKDVPVSSTFYSQITWLVDQGIATGYADGGFKPTAAVSRQAMAAFLYRYAGEPAFTPPAVSPFNDVPTDNPFYTAVTWLADQGITGGYPDGGFHPTAAVSRQAMAAFLYRYAGEPAYTPPATSPFTDLATDNPFYASVTWLADQGITGGYADGGFHPSTAVSRQAMAAFLYRFDGAVTVP